MIKLFFFGDIEVGCSQNSSIYTCFDEKKYIYRNRCLKNQLIINGHKTDTQLYKTIQYCSKKK